MKTKQQEELVEAFLALLEPRLAAVYRELILHLSGLGYCPKKQRGKIVFSHDLHHKQIVKIGLDSQGAPFFALRFSACRGYSKRFEDIVRDFLGSNKYRRAPCMEGKCSFCRGEALDRVYTYQFPDRETRYHCSTVALPIPGLGRGDVGEIKRLMDEEHRFLMEHEAVPGLKTKN